MWGPEETTRLANMQTARNLLVGVTQPIDRRPRCLTQCRIHRHTAETVGGGVRLTAVSERPMTPTGCRGSVFSCRDALSKGDATWNGSFGFASPGRPALVSVISLPCGLLSASAPPSLTVR